MHFRSRRIVSLAIVLICCLLTASRLTAEQSQNSTPATNPLLDSGRTVLHGNVHPLARAEFDRGEAPAQMPLHRMLLVLKRSNSKEAELRRLIENQQYNKSPNYHQWLSPQEFGKNFGIGDSDLAAVLNWLATNGFEVTHVNAGRTIIEFEGTAGQVRQAFQASIHRYLVDGEEHWANAEDPSIPNTLAGVVAGIDSLHDFRKQPQYFSVGTYSENTRQLTPANPAFTISDCGGSGSCFAVSPYDFATIYDMLPLWNANPAINGSGQTIAIVGRTDINPSDAPTFWSLFGLDGVHAPQPSLVITYNGPKPSINSDEPEADIDTQWSGAVAPGATINFVTSESTETTDGVDLSALYIVDNNLAPVMSESYGQCEKGLGSGGVSFYGALWEQAAAQGISVMVSTGDNGAAACDNPGGVAQNGLNVNGLASTPWNAAIGGTDFNEYQKWSTYWNSSNSPITQESAKSYIPETTWDDSCTNPLFQYLQGGSTNPETNCNNPNFSGYLDSTGGSGGESAFWLKPAWQTNTPNDNARDLPDISLFASNGFLGSFYVVCRSDIVGGQCNLNELQAYGGTSVSSPAFAGIMALVNQQYGPQGVPGLILYSLAGKQSSAFHDTPSGTTIAMPCTSGSPNCSTKTQGDHYGVLSGYSTGTGYDLATGLGSVDVASLVNNWSKVTFTPSTTSLTLNSGNAVNVMHGTAVPVAIGVTPSSPPASGDAALLVSPGTPGNPGFDFFPLHQGSATGTTSMLPGGNYSVIAHYAGDTRYGGSYSTPVSVNVSPENSSVYMPGLDTGVDGSGNPQYATSVVYASPYLLRADVRNSQGNFCDVMHEMACPTGNVNFTDNGQPLDAGSHTLNSQGYTEDQTVQLSGGTHLLRAQYGGDASFNPSSVSTTITITPALTALANFYAGAAAAGQQFYGSVYVDTSSVGVAPTGNVTFYANGTPMVGPVTYTPYNGNGSFYASLQAVINTTVSPFPTPGTYTISVSYSGDTNYSPSALPGQQLTVKYPQPGIWMVPSAPTVDPGTSVTFTTTVYGFSQTIAPTGTISMTGSEGPIPGTVTYTTVTDQNTGNLDLVGSIAYTPAFGDYYGAQYSGDSNFPGASGTSRVDVTGNDFTLWLPPQTTMTVKAGSYGQLTNLLVGLQSSSAPVTFSSSPCSGLPAETTCAVPGGFSYTSTGQIDVSTTGPHQVSDAGHTRGLNRWTSFGALAFAGIFLVGIQRKRRHIAARTAILSLALLLSGVACGGGGNSGGSGGGGGTHTDPGTPAGTYTITVTGTNGTTTHTVAFTLVVQP